MSAWDEYKEMARSRGALALELFVVESTPAGTPEEMQEHKGAHLDYQRQMEEQGALVLAGPLSDSAGEAMTGGGLIVYRAASMDEAREFASNDPMHKAGARSFTLRKWLVNEGSLSINVGLSTGTAKLA